MGKRELPPRNSRGKNTFYTKEIEKSNEDKTKAMALIKQIKVDSSNFSEGTIRMVRKSYRAKGSHQIRRELYN